jgi:hypothetical protein
MLVAGTRDRRIDRCRIGNVGGRVVGRIPARDRLFEVRLGSTDNGHDRASMGERVGDGTSNPSTSARDQGMMTRKRRHTRPASNYVKLL